MAIKGIICANCNRPSWKHSGSVNRSKRIGTPLYCGATCAGIARRQGKSIAQRKAEKAVYDTAYRETNFARLKSEKAAWLKRTYDAEKNKVRVKLRMPQHLEYCRRPEYREQKSRYDRAYRMQKHYGQWWQASMILLDLQAEIASRITRYEIAQQNGLLNKSTNRRREYDRTHCN